MGSGNSITLPSEYESLSEGEKASFNKKFEALVAGGSTPDAAMARLYKETLELIAALDPAKNPGRDVEGAIHKLKEMKASEDAGKFACAPGGKIEVLLTEMPQAVDAAVAAGLTPLVVDQKGNHDTFYSYNSVMIDSKKMGLDRSLKKVPLKDLMEEARQKLVGALRYGNIVVIAMTKAVTDFNGVFTDDSEEAQKAENEIDFNDGKMYFPRAALERAGRDLVQDKYLEGLYRDEDRESKMAICRDPDAFRVIITSMFEPADFEEFLFGNDWGLPKPLTNYAFIVIKDPPE